MTSKLEAILEICRCSLQLSKRGKGMGGGLSPVTLVLITMAAGRWNGAQDGGEVMGGGGGGIKKQKMQKKTKIQIKIH